MPLLDNTSRVKRDANITDLDVSITATTTTTSTTSREELVSKPLTPTTDSSSEELKDVLKKELEKVPVSRKEDVEKNLQSHQVDLKFDNVSFALMSTV